MRQLFLFILFTFSIPALGQQFAFEYWHDGKVILDSGDTLKGLIKYNLQTDLLQMQENKKNESYTARKVLFFEIFDKTVNKYRQFYSLPYATSGAYKASVFFELINEGKITLLSRESVEYRTFSSPYYFYGSYTQPVLVNNYFLLQENGDIVDFNEKKSDWLHLMGNRADDVQKYARSNHLSFDNKEDLSKIIAYYNSFFLK